MASHRLDEKSVPNINGWHQVKPRHGTMYMVRHRLRRAIAMVVVAALGFVGSAAGAMAVNLLLAPNDVKFIAQKKVRDEGPIDPNAHKPIDLLLLGQDTRDGGDNSALGGSDSAYDDDADEHNADTAMVMQISADRSYINMVSIPRDSLVDVPSCNTSRGTMPAQYGVMFNSIFANAYQTGGDLASAASCTVNAVNSLTGLNIQNFIVVDFQGLKNMIDAIGGVNICIPTDMRDDYTDLDVKRGLQHLDGTQATQYARMRHGTGTDGSDIMRTTRQQYLIKELVNQALSKNFMTHSNELYKLSQAALQSLSVSSGLDKPTILAGLAYSLRNFKVDHLYSQTISVVPAPNDSNRVVWSDNADSIWQKLRDNQPLTEAGDTSSDASQQQSQSGSDQSGAAQQGTDQSAQGQPSTTSQGTLDPKTGLITRPDGTLVDPATGGIVDPDDGSIRDPQTNQYIGIAYQYLNVTVCAVPAQK
ncbi:LCP family protein [Bifidobacterium sp. ESL0790]|uniref:LCP family protein n=1 Tax=Bifidobacterium sp. ESL0790 TaxID=2983233 RepID=UPI0023F9F822|nr:LCP family protein [Bifidobacterium sp. ESL0790]WEV73024.1 LCP family protein [Bifidobacterium sp. ESL0790]